MNWEAIGAVGEVLGAIGVIVTLGYLAVQIRQNTRTTRTATAQAIQTAMNQAFAPITQDLASARVYRLGLSEPSKLDEDERVQFLMTMYSAFAQFENIFYQHQEGTLDSAIFSRHCGAMEFHLQAPGGAKWWESNRGSFSEDFGRFLDSISTDGAPGTPPGVDNTDT